MNDVTRILSAIEQGDPRAAEQLLPLVYDELRKLAAHRLAQEKPGQTLQATALVHDAYLRLVGPDGARGWDGRGHFFAAAAEAMRRILVENARRKAGPKAGGDRKRVDLDAVELAVEGPRDDLIALDEALDRAWRPRTVARPTSSSSATSPACPSSRPPRSSASPSRRPITTGLTRRGGCAWPCPAANRRSPGLTAGKKFPGR